MKYLIVLIASIIGQAILIFKVTFFKEVTGDYIICNGITVSKWQRCRVIHDANIVCFYQPLHMIHIKNWDFSFTIKNVNISTRSAI
jgi:hypothetical protein